MISSGGRVGGSGLLGRGGAGNFVDSGGCIGPAACACRDAGAAARNKTRAQHAARRFDRGIMDFASICWMQFAVNLQHEFLRDPGLFCSFPATVYLAVGEKGGLTNGGTEG